MSADILLQALIFDYLVLVPSPICAALPTRCFGDVVTTMSLRLAAFAALSTASHSWVLGLLAAKRAA